MRYTQNEINQKQYKSQFSKTPKKSKVEFVAVTITWFWQYFNISLSGKNGQKIIFIINTT